MNILLDTDVALGALIPRGTRGARCQAAVEKVRQEGNDCWIPAIFAPRLKKALEKSILRHRLAPDSVAAQEQAGRRLEAFGLKCRWLSTLAGDLDGHFDPLHTERQVLLRALERFSGQSRILTLNKGLLANSARAITPQDFLGLPSEPPGIPFCDLLAQQRRIQADLEQRIHQVLYGGKYILGPEIKELEDVLATYVGTQHCVTVASGTDALQIALMALEIGPGDEVITVPYTWISTAAVIPLVGARPVFVDIDPETFNLDPEKLASAITKQTKAIIPVGLYGQCADMDRINSVAYRHGLAVIEDAAQSFGAMQNGRRSCSLSLVGTTSFFPSKPLGGYGDGGALFTSDGNLAERLRWIRIHGQREKHRHPILGLNGRLDTLQAAILLAKMGVFPEDCGRRREAARRYDALLAGLPGIRTPIVAPRNEPVYAQYTILVNHREAVAGGLERQGIPVTAYYAVPLHLQEVFRPLGYREGDFPVAERISAQGLSLPMSADITAAQQERVASGIRAAIGFGS